jgi:hypothetical protein
MVHVERGGGGLYLGDGQPDSQVAGMCVDVGGRVGGGMLCVCVCWGVGDGGANEHNNALRYNTKVDRPTTSPSRQSKQKSTHTHANHTRIYTHTLTHTSDQSTLYTGLGQPPTGGGAAFSNLSQQEPPPRLLLSRYRGMFIHGDRSLLWRW